MGKVLYKIWRDENGFFRTARFVPGKNTIIRRLYDEESQTYCESISFYAETKDKKRAKQAFAEMPGKAMDEEQMRMEIGECADFAPLYRAI